MPLLFMLLASIPAAAPFNDTPTIVVTGIATAIAAPDKVDVFLLIQTDEAAAESSMKENDHRLNAVMAATRSVGIAPADVQLSTVSMNTQSEYDRDGRFKGTKYTVRKELVLCLRTPAKLDGLLVEVSKAKALVSRIDFAADALRQAEDQLPVKAVENARTRAEKMAAPVGATLGRALKIRTIEPAEGSRGRETYSTGGGTNVGAAATGALTSSWHVEVEFELIPAAKK